MLIQNEVERRRYKRYAFHEDIIIDGSKHCTTMDISEGGLYVSAMQIFEKGNVIEITIPFGEQNITVKAKVQYCQPGIGMGIMFIDLNEQQKMLIKKLIDRIKENTSE
ncbi:MAG: PilZ domain-containing protein [Nitrospirae bacterium]|nr:PilZ domain-containing protein [Nitrospirota bacterium]